MPPRTVRTTVALPAELLDAADRAVRSGKARSRNDLLAMGLRREIEAQERASIDAAFHEAAGDEDVQEEAQAIAREFALADWEALQLEESE